MQRESVVHFTSWPFFFANRLVVCALHCFLTKWDQTKSITVARSEFGRRINAPFVSKLFLSMMVCAININIYICDINGFKGQSHAFRF